MSAHLKKHSILSSEDHSVDAAAAGELNAIVANDEGALVTKAIEAQGAAAAAGYIPQRDANGDLLVPETPSSDNAAVAKKYVEQLVAAGIWKSGTAQVLDNHTEADASKCAVGKCVVDKTDKKVYKITAIDGTAITFAEGYLPTTPEIRVAEDTDSTLVYDVEGNAWIDQGSSSHAKLHAMTDETSHTAGAFKVFYSDGDGKVKELALGTSGKVFKSQGAEAAPEFGTLAINDLANTIQTGSDVVPVAADMADDAVGTIRLINGTDGGLFIAIKTASGVKSVELD